MGEGEVSRAELRGTRQARPILDEVLAALECAALRWSPENFSRALFSWCFDDALHVSPRATLGCGSRLGRSRLTEGTRCVACDAAITSAPSLAGFSFLATRHNSRTPSGRVLISTGSISIGTFRQTCALSWHNSDRHVTEHYGGGRRCTDPCSNAGTHWTLRSRHHTQQACSPRCRTSSCGESRELGAAMYVRDKGELPPNTCRSSRHSSTGNGGLMTTVSQTVRPPAPALRDGVEEAPAELTQNPFTMCVTNRALDSKRLEGIVFRLRVDTGALLQA